MNVARADLEDEELMRYLDGELPPKEARRIEERLTASAEVRAQLQALEQLREVMRARVAVAQEEAGPRLDALWGRLEGSLAPPAAAPAGPGFWARVREWLETYRAHVMTGALSAAAGATIAILAMRGAPVQTGQLPAKPVPEPVAAMGVEDLDVPDGTPTIFQIPSDDGKPPTTVIWVDEGAPPADDTAKEPI